MPRSAAPPLAPSASSPSLSSLLARRRWLPAEAREVLKAWEAEGSTQATFARAHGIDEKRLSRWRTRLAREGAAEVTPIRLISVQVVAPSGAPPLEVHVGCARVVVRPGFDAEFLRSVVSALGTLPC